MHSERIKKKDNDDTIFFSFDDEHAIQMIRDEKPNGYHLFKGSIFGECIDWQRPARRL
jgi:hypothetical protein